MIEVHKKDLTQNKDGLLILHKPCHNRRPTDNVGLVLLVE